MGWGRLSRSHISWAHAAGRRSVLTGELDTGRYAITRMCEQCGMCVEILELCRELLVSTRSCFVLHRCTMILLKLLEAWSGLVSIDSLLCGIEKYKNRELLRIDYIYIRITLLLLFSDQAMAEDIFYLRREMWFLIHYLFWWIK